MSRFAAHLGASVVGRQKVSALLGTNDRTTLFPVLLGLGANIGDPGLQLGIAVDRLRDLVEIEAVSRVYRTKPIGHTDQPDFLNLVLTGRTSHPAHALLAALRRIEAELGRERRIRNGPRTIDIDILDHDGAVLVSDDLVLPHPRMHDRAFVLVPLAEVAPTWTHPVSGRGIREMLRDVDGADEVVSLGRVEEFGPPSSA